MMLPICRRKAARMFTEIFEEVCPKGKGLAQSVLGLGRFLAAKETNHPKGMGGYTFAS
jgi:hypothetical protein